VNLSQLTDAMRELGVERILVKRLAPNDNSKNQVYLESGTTMESMNILPNTGVTIDSAGANRNERLKASLHFEWLNETGQIARAPHAQLILYPQYPEVRFSGFLRGCRNAPSELMRSRQSGRILFFGLSADSRIIGYVAGPSSSIVRELDATNSMGLEAVFGELSIGPARTVEDDRDRLLAELGRIHRLGWIDGKRMKSDGSVMPHRSQQAVGYTLEAELGIVPNSSAKPDYFGWEIKAHTVTNFRRAGSGRLTLFTPEPTYGFYRTHGAAEFVMQFGRQASDGTPGKMYFSGQHRVGIRSPKSGLTLRLNGYVPPNQITDPSGGGIELLDDAGCVVAGWGFDKIMTHWTRKHARAAFIPAMRRTEPDAQFWYSDQVRLCSRSDFWMLLNSLWEGTALYDPGVKVEGADTARPVPKARNQFRIPFKSVQTLYRDSEEVSVL